MAGKVGMVVCYTPTAKESKNFNNQTAQMAAVITAWNEETEKASLAIFVPGASYIAGISDIVEGTEAGEFQQVAA